MRQGETIGDDMDQRTSAAISAFRRSEGLRRRMAQAERILMDSVRAMPVEDLGLYYVHTEVIRLQEDLKLARDNSDRAAVVWCEAKILELEEKARKMRTPEEQEYGFEPRPDAEVVQPSNEPAVGGRLILPTEPHSHGPLKSLADDPEHVRQVTQAMEADEARDDWLKD